ncbi:hypothetical protein [Chitinimonas sp.]|uniref:hypothetical protein n=1 Tax=Chitinimonas sp. TaxID=1934313 RepID=UPI0035AEC839
MPRQGWLTTACLFALLLLISVALHHDVLSAWWRFDDPSVLRFAIEHSPLQYFFHASVWKSVATTNFTPWAYFSFGVDYRLFGLSPKGFYWHQLVSLAACATLGYLLLRRYLSASAALCGALAFLLGAPSTQLAGQLMSRHYIEGLGFMMAALLCLMRSPAGRIWIWAGTGFYLLACLAKEVYVPLPFLLPLLLTGAWRDRLGRAAPFFLTFAAYMLWRWHMLGSLGQSGYATELPSMALVWHTARQFPELLLGSGMFAWPAYAALLIAVLVLLREGRLPAMLASLGLLVAPLVPLMVKPGVDSPNRFLFLFWWALVMATGAAAGMLCRRLPGRASPLACLLLATLALGGFHQGKQAMLPVAAANQRFDVQGRFLWLAGADTVLLTDPLLSGVFWYRADLLKLREFNSQSPSAPAQAYDESMLVGETRPIHRYDEACGCMRAIDLAPMLADWRSRTIETMPLSLDISLSNDIFSWHFGPRPDGLYTLLVHEPDALRGAIPMAAQGTQRFKIRLDQRVVVQLRYQSTDGRLGYSERLVLPPGANTTLSWQSKGRS